jgi:hypothetical protein
VTILAEKPISELEHILSVCMCMYTCVNVLVTLVIQHAMRMDHTVICGLSSLILFSPHDIKHDMIFGKKLLKIRGVSSLSLQICMKHFSF